MSKQYLLPMSTLPAIEGYKLTALLKEDELRLFEEVPTIRLKIGKDHLNRWVLHVINTEISVNPNQFNGWWPEWGLNV